MRKIILPGKKEVLKATKRFECPKCGCVFDADKDDYETGTQYNDVYYSCECPMCGVMAYPLDH